MLVTKFAAVLFVTYILRIMKRKTIRALSIFIFLYVTFGIYLSLNQTKVVYHPSPQDFASCEYFADAQKVNHQGTRMYVETNEKKPTVILYHGNAGSACNRYFYADMFSQAGYGYIVVEYAGYSNDTQAPSHALIKQDVESVVSYLDDYQLSSVYVVGVSIGTGAATYHTSLKAPEKLLLISPFTDLQAVAKDRFWFYPTSLLVDNAFDNVSALENYSGDTTIIHGTADTIIPYALGQELFQSLSGSKKLISIPEAGHNDLFRHAVMYQAIKEFLEESP